MLANIGATLLSVGASLALLAFMAALGAIAVAYALDVQTRYYRRGLRRYLSTMRRQTYTDNGLHPSGSFLLQLTTQEANQILDAGAAGTQPRPRFALNLHHRLQASLSHPDVLADFKGPARAPVAENLGRIGRELERRWLKVFAVLTFAIALVACALFQYNTLAALAHAPRGLPAWLPPPWIEGTAFFYADGLRWQNIAGIIVSAVLCAFLGGGVLQRWFQAQTQRDRPAAPAPRTVPKETEVPTIGRPGQPIRTISFSAGGFDTLMDLGVIHALIVIQGRAPDAVVGLSAGGIHAAALADVLQAGEEAEAVYLESGPWNSLPEEKQVELQQVRLLARVKRLRYVIENAQRAHERLIDSVLPDAYQIDVARPLEPLAQPRFAVDERNQRRAFVIARTGLARLYNDLLNVPFQFSTLAKVARRLLGIVASTEIPAWPTRWAVRMIETVRLWILIGANLVALAKLSRVLLRPLVIPVKVEAATAAAIIFRSRAWDRTARGAFYVVAFATIFVVWTAASISILPFVAVLTLVVLLTSTVYRRDPNSKSATTDILQGLLMLAPMTVLAALAIAAVGAILVGTNNFASGPVAALKSQPVVTAWAAAPGWTALEIWRYSTIFTCTLIFALALMRRLTLGNPRGYAERFLSSYGLGDAIFRPHGLRSMFADVFDRNFHLKSGLNRAVEAALHNELELPASPEEAHSQAPPKTVGDYSSRARLENERIHVGIAVANTETGALEVVPRHVPVVDALMAGMAVTPWLPPAVLPRVEDDGRVRDVLYVDGANVTREPSHALLKMLRELRTDRAGLVHMYAVAPFPLSRAELGDALRDDLDSQTTSTVPSSDEAEQPGRRYHQYLDLVDIVWRAMRLQRFRDATLERRLTELFTATIPESQAKIDLGPQGNDTTRSNAFLRVWVAPVELEYDADLNRRLYRSNPNDRRRIIQESIADGCRAAMQVMIPDAINAMGTATARGKVARCGLSVQRHLGDPERGLSAKMQALAVPGSDWSLGPGLSDICTHCTLNRPRLPHKQVGAEPTDQVAPASGDQSLLLADWSSTAPSWPHERQPSEPAAPPNKSFQRPESSHRVKVREAWERYAATKPPWPPSRKLGARNTVCGRARPTISLLFSGGVFRGVYQLGVLNGLHELGVKPDLVAGASVGSITGAMIGEAFSLRSSAERHARIARLTGVYLAIDRLILTDRFADFVRNLTLRAAEARFSIRHADRVFRKYDHPTLIDFDRTLRRVVAGIERLFYIGPYQLNELIRAFRARDAEKLPQLLESSVQRFLERMQITDEALGAEALRELVDYYVVGTKGPGSDHPIGVTLDELRVQNNLIFLATATNLTRGRLEVLGEAPASAGTIAPILTESLLASSAFPGVFRPRWSWELTPGAAQVHQFIDGGVMDNLPVDAIASVLHRAASVNLVAAQPSTPHLIIGASLEVRAPAYALAFTRERLRRNWIALRARAAQLRYNTKLDTYQYAERALREIRAFAQAKHPDDDNVRNSALVGLTLVAIKPDWLCGTFAFHPMLGFRRARQAASIAHGCATTLLEFARLAKSARPADLSAWGIKKEALPTVTTWTEALALQKSDLKQGSCWLRDGVMCPFSEVALRKNDQRLAKAWHRHDVRSASAAAKPAPAEKQLGERMIRQISRIHNCCQDRTTHLRPI
jgi:predicted acylesterase/phospholipase RssA